MLHSKVTSMHVLLTFCPFVKSVSLYDNETIGFAGLYYYRNLGLLGYCELRYSNSDEISLTHRDFGAVRLRWKVMDPGYSLNFGRNFFSRNFLIIFGVMGTHASAVLTAVLGTAAWLRFISLLANSTVEQLHYTYCTHDLMVPNVPWVF